MNILPLNLNLPKIQLFVGEFKKYNLTKYLKYL